MKLKTHIYLLLILVGLAFTACNKQELTEDQKMKIAYYDQNFEKSKGNSFDKPVDAAMALKCINFFTDKRDRIKFYRTGEIKRMLETEAVGFELNKLKDWLNSLPVGNVDTIRVQFGSYTPEAITIEGQSMDLENRLTVFLWPYKNKKMAVSPNINNSTKQVSSVLISPYNIGQLYP
jgi:hypothetical protein